jgi:hypothetical protein
MLAALSGTRMTGLTGFVGMQTADVPFDGLALLGKTAIGILEGSADPRTFIPCHSSRE